MWTDDHNPPMPTTRGSRARRWNTRRTVFIPIFPYVGDAAIQVGLYSTADAEAAAAAGEDVGQRAYKVAKLQLLPQTENIFTVFKDGWHPAEVAEHNGGVEWQWTKTDATLAFKNPKKDVVFYFDVGQPGQRGARSSAGAGQPQRAAGRRTRAQAQGSGAEKDPADRRAAGDGRDGGTARLGR